MLAVVLFNAIPTPAKIADTEPSCIAKEPVLVRAEVPVPVMLPPPCRVTVPTVSLWSVPRSKIAVAPFTVRLLKSSMDPASINVPAVTVVVPV